MKTHSLSRARQGFTLIELLVVISIIAILASMLIPAVGMIQRGAQKSYNAKSMNGIMTGLIAYVSDNNRFPSFGSTTNTDLEMNSTGDQTLATIGAFARLMEANPADITYKLFQLRGAGLAAGPDKTKRPQADWASSDVSGWGWNPTYYIPIAFDWSAPSNAGSNRVVLGDRDHSIVATDVIQVVCGDGHFETIEKGDITPVASAGTVVDPSGATALVTALFRGAGWEDDNIYDAASPEEAEPTSFMTTMHKGHPVKSFLK